MQPNYLDYYEGIPDANLEELIKQLNKYNIVYRSVEQQSIELVSIEKCGAVATY